MTSVVRSRLVSVTLISLFWSPSIADDNVFLLKRGRRHVLMKFKTRGGCTDLSPISWPSNLEIRWHRKACGDRLSEWLQCPVGDPVCRDPPARGQHMGFICRGSHPRMGAAG